MSCTKDPVRKKYGPMLDKSLVSSLAHRIGKEFPRMGGQRIRRLCAEMVLEVVNGHLRPKDHVRHGQVLWLAVSIGDPPRRSRRIAETDLVPVVLDLHEEQDIHDRIGRKKQRERLERKAVRLSHQAYEQGGLLSNCDLAELLNTSDPRISQLLVAYEKRTGRVVPRRATVHDVGSGLTHKSIICRKRFLDGLSPDRIARETHHSQQAVDHYLGQYDRVLHCETLGMTPEETAYTLNCSLGLVEEYLAIADEIAGPCHNMEVSTDENH